VIARLFDGGGHDKASGCMLDDKKQIKNVVTECIKIA
jgi:nanoRNase/pAp phosphatase (c-di-AMP/oligoRNAs hydrolase)